MLGTTVGAPWVDASSLDAELAPLACVPTLLGGGSVVVLAYTLDAFTTGGAYVLHTWFFGYPQC